MPAEQKVALERLRAHGIQLERLTAPVTAALQEFEVATSTTTAQAFENHQERTVTGTWVPVDRTVPAGAWQGIDDASRWHGWPSTCWNRGRTTDWSTWNVLDEALKSGRSPILRTRD